jgi:hypothetical protein
LAQAAEWVEGSIILPVQNQVVPWLGFTSTTECFIAVPSLAPRLTFLPVQLKVALCWGHMSMAECCIVAPTSMRNVLLTEAAQVSAARVAQEQEQDLAVQTAQGQARVREADTGEAVTDKLGGWQYAMKRT